MRKLLIVLLGCAPVLLAWADADKSPDTAEPPAMTPLRRDVQPFEYMEAKVPVYRGGGRTDILTKMQKPLSPIESMKHFVHPQHLEVQLVVAEPDLGGKPIAFNWDERGRLWVAVTTDYPNNLQPQGQGHDRLVICEDTNHDGRIDRVKTFADRLSIPTSFVFAYDGVVIHAPPHTLFLRDNDGDDRADEWHILLSGWGTYDTHAGPSSLLYGLDNWIYGTVGYAGFQGRIAGEHYRFSQGIYRFQLQRDPHAPKAPPRVASFEFLRNTTNNTWGLGISEDGELFASTANGNPSVHLDIPNRYYEKVQGWSAGPLLMIADSARFYPITNNVRQVDFHGRFTAASGHLLYTARTYPPIYWNRVAFVAEPTGHLVASLVLERQGSGYRARYGWNLLASDDEWCAPIAAAVGPDGQVWVIDWYSYIVQHNPTPPGFRTGRGN
ncbi:MAG: glycosyl hydrolase, partial [Gemmatales bacterium]|nr:glycosyl hydrolase [Gemmatales bacterium]